MDLARDLVRLAGRDPDSQPIDIVGLRPGEKLHEELFYDSERVEPTENPKVLRAEADRAPAGVREDVRGLMALATGNNEDLLRGVLLDYARGLSVAVTLQDVPAPDGQSAQSEAEAGVPVMAPQAELASIGAGAAMSALD